MSSSHVWTYILMTGAHYGLLFTGIQLSRRGGVDVPRYWLATYVEYIRLFVLLPPPVVEWLLG